MTDHPTTPPPELVQQWYDEAKRDPCGPTNWVATRAAQWGADQELEACVDWLARDYLAADLRIARRPKPPSLAEEALELARPAGAPGAYVTFGPDELATIRRALERLQELEGND